MSQVKTCMLCLASAKLQMCPFAEGEQVSKLSSLLFFGDQLTVERARHCQAARVNSDTDSEALLGLLPSISDWHAEANFLEVLFYSTLYILIESEQGWFWFLALNDQLYTCVSC